MPVKTDEKQGERRGGRFRPGESGNPAGRPKGSRNRVTQICADLLADASAEVMERVIRMAKRGDRVALRLCVERLLPVRAARDRAVDVEMPEAAQVADLVTAAAAVVAHAAAGRITLSEAREFMALLEGQRKVIETADLAVRIAALEEASERREEEAERPPDLAARVRRLGFVPTNEGRRGGEE